MRSSSTLMPSASFNLGMVGSVFLEVERLRLGSGCPGAHDAQSTRQHLEHAARESMRKRAYNFPRAEAGDLREPDLRNGVFTGEAGLGYVELIYAHHTGESSFSSRGLTRVLGAFARHENRPKAPSELYMGTAGYVALTTDLRTRGVDCAELRTVRRRAAGRLLTRHTNSLKGRNLSGGHGATGELLALSLVPEDISPQVLRSRLDDLSDVAHIDEDYVAWPVERGGRVPPPRWGSFCGGVAAQAMLFARAYVIYSERRYASMARRCAQTCLALKGSGGDSLCCGGVGSALAVERVARVLSDSGLHSDACAWLERLRSPQWCSTGSLMQGSAGRSWLSLMLDYKEPLAFPVLSGLLWGDSP